MTPQDPKHREEVHQGHELESGLLERLRDWSDVFPWIQLGRTLRVAGSPPLVLLVAVAIAIASLGNQLIFGIAYDDGAIQASRDATFVTFVDHFRGLVSTSIFYPRLGATIWMRVGLVVWSVLVWTPVALLLARQGALLTAGRTMVGLTAGLSLAIRRTPSAWVTSMVPLACVVAIGVLIVVIGWIGKLVEGLPAIETAIGWLAALVAIPCGVLAFGALAAVPLGWAAIINERDPDAIDSLSRGYEYLYRRPLRLVMYVVVGATLLAVAWALAMGISQSAIYVGTMLLELAGTPPKVLEALIDLLQRLPLVVVLTMVWSLIGGVYLLLRHDAGSQDVEDLWQPAPDPRSSLPQLPG